MANYTLSNYEKRIVLINVGDPFGYVPVVMIKILDGWGVDVDISDNIDISLAAEEDIKRFTDAYPTIISAGGGLVDFNESAFNGYTYPLTSIPTSDGSYIRINNYDMYQNEGALTLDVFLGGEHSILISTISDRLKARIRATGILCDVNGRMFAASNVLGSFEYDDTLTNSYLAANNNGLPFNITSGTSIISTGAYPRSIPVVGFLNLSEIDYKESVIPTNDPFGQGGTTDGTGHTGGTGTFDNTGDSIDIPSLPTLSAADTGFITLFNPSAGQLRDLANYMWSNPLFDLDAWKKIFADPMDAILGLSIVPVDVPSGSTSPVTVGNISTGVSMTKAASQYVEVDCGSLNVKEFWGAYLDYAPYTKCEIHLPYCGIHPIDVDEIMNKTVTVKYHIDILSGACCAYVKCGDSVLYEFAGQCAASIPITGDNWTNVINGVMQIAASVGSMVATGGLAAPVTGANAAASIGQAVAIDANIASTIMSMKPSIEKSGSLGGVGGMLAIQKPYLILSRPRQALPSGQNHFTGYPSFITMQLAELIGYTEIEHIHLENIPATSEELTEIETLLRGGVLF